MRRDGSPTSVIGCELLVVVGLIAAQPAWACQCIGVGSGEVFPDEGTTVPRNAHFWAYPVGRDEGAAVTALTADGEPWPVEVIEHWYGDDAVWVEVVPEQDLPADAIVGLLLVGVEVATWETSEATDDEPPRWDGELEWKLQESPEEFFSCGHLVVLEGTASNFGDDSPVVLLAEPVDPDVPELVGPNGSVETGYNEDCGGYDSSLLEDGGRRTYLARLVDVAGNGTDEVKTRTRPRCGCASGSGGSSGALAAMVIVELVLPRRRRAR